MTRTTLEKTYQGKRSKQYADIFVDVDELFRTDEQISRAWLPLSPRRDLVNLGAYDWGYPGTRGPAQLALAILADVLGDDASAIELHQPFRDEVIAKLPWDNFSLTVEEVRSWVAAHRGKGGEQNE